MSTIYKAPPKSWKRPASWPTQPIISRKEQKVAMLVSISDYDSNWIAIQANGGDFSVDWGDGTVEHFEGGTIAQRNYNFDDVVVRTQEDGAKLFYAYITPQAGQVLENVNFAVSPTIEGVEYVPKFQPIIEIIYSMPGSNTAPVIGPREDYWGSYHCCRLLNFVGVNMGGTINGDFLFAGLQVIKNISLDRFTKYTSCAYMFAACLSLVRISRFNTAQATNMSYMFADCSNLTRISKLDMSIATNTSNMFSYSGLSSIYPLSIPSSQNAFGMFRNCTSLKSIIIEDMSSVPTLGNMFNDCRSLESVTLKNTNSLSDCSSAFSDLRNLTYVNLFDTSLVTNMNYMFHGCWALKTIPKFNTSNVTSMVSFCQYCDSLEELPLLDTSNVLEFAYAFDYCTNLKQIPAFDLSSTQYAPGIFQWCLSLKDVPPLNLDSATHIHHMLYECSNIEKITLNFGNNLLADNSALFGGCRSLKDAELNNFKNSPLYINGDGTILSESGLTKLMESLGTNESTTYDLNISANFGNKGTVVRSCLFTQDSNVIIMGDTSGLQVGMQVTGPGTGLTDGDPKFANIITAISENESITLDQPMVSSGEAALAFRTLPTRIAILKNWTVIG